MAMEIGVLKLGWDVLKTGVNWFKQKPSPIQAPADTSPLAVVARFISLFENHGVKRSQIATFFGLGLTLKDFKDDDSLLEAITEEQLQAAIELFGVRREWLDGVDSQIYDTRRIDKNLKEFSSLLEELKSRGVSGGALFVPESDMTRKSSSLLVLEEPIGELGEMPVYRYHTYSGWIFPYWKSRAFITACVAIAWEKQVYVHGQKLPPTDMGKLSEGTEFIGVSEWHGGLPHLGQRWEPEDLADNPKVYLDGVDEGSFGKVSALEKWLDLEAQGFMRSGFGDPPREAFQRALNELNHFCGLGVIGKFKYRRRTRKSGENSFLFD